MGSFCWSFLAALDARGHPFLFGVFQSNLGNVCHVEVFNSDDCLYVFKWIFLLGISRDSTHKRRATGGKKKSWRKKRK